MGLPIDLKTIEHRADHVDGIVLALASVVSITQNPDFSEVGEIIMVSQQQLPFIIGHLLIRDGRVQQFLSSRLSNANANVDEILRHLEIVCPPKPGSLSDYAVDEILPPCPQPPAVPLDYAGVLDKGFDPGAIILTQSCSGNIVLKGGKIEGKIEGGKVEVKIEGPGAKVDVKINLQPKPPPQDEHPTHKHYPKPDPTPTPKSEPNPESQNTGEEVSEVEIPPPYLSEPVIVLVDSGEASIPNPLVPIVAPKGNIDYEVIDEDVVDFDCVDMEDCDLLA